MIRRGRESTGEVAFLKKSSAKNFLSRALSRACADTLHEMGNRYDRTDFVASARQKVLRSFFKSDLPRRFPPPAESYFTSQSAYPTEGEPYETSI